MTDCARRCRPMVRPSCFRPALSRSRRAAIYGGRNPRPAAAIPARRRSPPHLLRHRRAQYPGARLPSCLCRPRSGRSRIPRLALHFCQVWCVGLPADRFYRPLKHTRCHHKPIQQQAPFPGSGYTRRRFGYFAAAGKVPRPQAKPPRSLPAGFFIPSPSCFAIHLKVNWRSQEKPPWGAPVGGG